MKPSKSTPSGGDGRNRPAYDAAQTNEERLFLGTLQQLCWEVEKQQREAGYRTLRPQDLVFSAVFKVYSTKSARRFMENLREVQEKGLIKTAPSPTSLAECMRSTWMPNLLQRLIVKSSLPLSEAEDVFAADSTSFSLPRKRIWFNKHTMRRQKRRDHLKLHVMIGVKTKIITYAEATVGTASDMAYLKQLVEGTARYFDLSEVSADAGYLSGENLYTVLLHGGIPYFAFKKNCALDADYKSTFWKDLLYLWKTRHPLYTEHYFRRNNVEATFHSIKAKFGSRLYSKSTSGQRSEALAKALCHNICTLIRATHELGIDPLAWSDKIPKPSVEGVTITEAMRHRKADLLEIRNAAGSRELPPQEEVARRSRRAKPRKGSDCAPVQIRLFE
jgi:transposase